MSDRARHAVPAPGRRRSASPGTTATRCASSARWPTARRRRRPVATATSCRSAATTGCRWLHSICSQHVSDLADGDATEALVLSPHGHVEQHWQVAELGGDGLDRHRARRRADRARLPAEDALPQARRAGRRLGRLGRAQRWSARRPPTSLAPPACRSPRPAAPSPLDGGGFVRRMPWPGRDAADLVVPRPTPAGATSSGCTPPAPQPAGMWAFEALRVEARRPRLGLRDRPPHDPARGRLDRRRRPPATRAATAGRRPSRGCTTWASRRGGWCCCTCPASPTSCPRRAPPVELDGRDASASSARRCTTTNSARSRSP